MQWKTYRFLRLSCALALALSVSLSSAGCKRDAGEGSSLDTDSHEPGGAVREATGQPAPVKPPFEVNGELDGLLLVWFDAEGLHTAQTRSEIPEAQRAAVRVDSLHVAPDERLDPDHVYVADLRNASQDGSYPVRKAARAWFDAQVDRAQPAPPTADAARSQRDQPHSNCRLGGLVPSEPAPTP